MSKIMTEEEYEAALRRINSLMNVESGTVDGAELDMLADMVCKYEEQTYSKYFQ